MTENNWLLLVTLITGFIIGLTAYEFLDGDYQIEPQMDIGINETYLAEMEAARRQNIDVWLAPNMTENYTITVPGGSNVTIWQGGKIISYIPAN